MKNRRKSGRPAGDGMDIPREMFKHSADAWNFKYRWHMRKKDYPMCELWKTSAKTFLDWCLLQRDKLPNHEDYDFDIEKNCIKYGNNEYHPALCMLMHHELNLNLESLDKRLRTLLNMPTKDPMRSESLVQDLKDFRKKAKIRCSKPDQMDEGIQERISLITRDYYAGEKEIQLSLPFLKESES